MNVGVHLFAGAREAVGQQTITLQLAEAVDVDGLLEALCAAYPAVTRIARVSRVAVNQEYVPGDCLLKDGDEIALIPPVSGGSGLAPFKVVDREIRPDELHDLVRSDADGAVLTFSGVVRDSSGMSATSHLEYEAYAPMAEAAMRKLADEARERWPISAVGMVHRVGRLEIGEISILLSVSSPHRAEAFAAGQYLIDRLKEEVPVWKKEVGPDGSYWVEGPGEHVSGGGPR
jgi:molybdopterin converting factor subunit 1